MRTFQDAEGREWKVAITVPSIERVLQATGLNIVNPLAPRVGAAQHDQPDILTLLLNDVSMYAKVLIALLSRQFEKAGVDPKDFPEALNAAAIGASWKAFREEWNDFFQSRQQPEMIALLNQQEKTQATVAGAMVKFATGATTAAETKLQVALDKATAEAAVVAVTEPLPPKPSTDSDSVTSGPESVESIPAA